MGGSSEEIAANGSEVNGLGSSKAQNFSGRQEEDGRGFTCALGGVPGGEEESGLVAWGMDHPRRGALPNLRIENSPLPDFHIPVIVNG
jgi:hypothetical protein